MASCPNRPHGEYDPYCEVCDGRHASVLGHQHAASASAAAPPDIDPVIARGWALRWRGIEGVACGTCLGAGVRWYSSTATWRGGMGGQRSTRDICDDCWGSGDSTRPWLNLLTRRDDEQRKLAEDAVGLLARESGAELRSMRPQVQALVQALGELADATDRARKPRPGRDLFFVSLVRSLKSAIERALIS